MDADITAWSDFTIGPIHQIDHDWGGPDLFLKRLDLIQSWASGNKYYKLKYNMLKALSEGIGTIVSKGGMFSNHLEALARACEIFKIRCICIVRSYGNDENNPTIQKLKGYHAEVNFVNPADYNAFNIEQASSLYPDSLFILEGGSDENGIRGAAEIWNEIEIHNPTHIIIAGGTLSTAAGILSLASSSVHVIIIPAWKNCKGEYMQALLLKYGIHVICSWEIWPDYHFGGFAKYDEVLEKFMHTFSTKTGIPLEPVYTGKMMFAIRDKMQSGYFSIDAKVMAIHSGGLQGINGFKYRDPMTWSRYSDLFTPKSPKGDSFDTVISSIKKTMINIEEKGPLGY